MYNPYLKQKPRHRKVDIHQSWGGGHYIIIRAFHQGAIKVLTFFVQSDVNPKRMTKQKLFLSSYSYILIWSMVHYSFSSFCPCKVTNVTKWWSRESQGDLSYGNAHGLKVRETGANMQWDSSTFPAAPLCAGTQEVTDSAKMWSVLPLPIVSLSLITLVTWAEGRKAISVRGAGIVSSLSSDNLLTHRVWWEKNDFSHVLRYG